MATATANRPGLPMLGASTTPPTKKRLPLLEESLAAQRDLTAVERFSQQHEDVVTPLHAQHYQALLPASPPGPGQQYAFRVDLDACSGCKACVTACHSLNGLDEGETWRSVGVLHGGAPEAPVQQTVTTACHHCVDPACMSGCPVGAYEKDPDTGIVRHLDDQCIGCQYCTLTCPYEVPQYNAKKGIVRKCDMCSDRLAEGEAPACVQACPSEAISIQVIDTQQAIDSAQSDVFLPGAPSPGITVPTTSYVSTQALPRNVLPADFYALKTSHIHAPLVFMLVLTQLSVGAFFVGELAPAWLPPLALEAVRPWHGLVAMALGLLAIGASTAHLGRPLYAFRAVLGVRTSWLSREILAFGLFAGAAVSYALVLFTGSLGAEAQQVLGFTAAATGLLGVFCSVMLYATTHRAWWNGAYTGFKFTLTTAVLGLAVTTAVTAVVVATGGAGPDGAAALTGWMQMAGPALAVVTLVKLLGEAWVLTHLRDRQQGQLKRTALLLVGELRSVTGARVALALLGGVLLPLVFIAPPANVGLEARSVVACVSAVLLFGGELLERVMFFAALSAPRMPGVV